MKYKLKTKIGQRVSKIEINIRSDADKQKDTSINKEGVHINNLKIVYQTRYKIALNDSWITKLDRQSAQGKKSSYWHYLEDTRVNIVTRETFFSNGIFGTIYTTGSISDAIKKLTKAMQVKVNKEYGFLANIDIEKIVSDFRQKEIDNLPE